MLLNQFSWGFYGELPSNCQVITKLYNILLFYAIFYIQNALAIFELFFRNSLCGHQYTQLFPRISYMQSKSYISQNKTKKNTIFLIDDILYNYQFTFVILIEMLYVTIRAYIGKPFPSRFSFLHFITYVTSKITVITISAIIIILEIRLIISCTDLSAKPFGILATQLF